MQNEIYPFHNTKDRQENEQFNNMDLFADSGMSIYCNVNWLQSEECFSGMV